ncbi:MAG: hypothetical protein PHF37_00745 [Phycisphaerae bacterium]|nr:hypothetical protein [Phycisphaerae bacterium]
MVSDSEHKSRKKKIVHADDIDMQMLEDNLKRSYAERIRRHQIALETMEKLQKAKFL